MKKIIVLSKKHGEKEILLDDDVYDIISKYKWSVAKDHNTFYATRQIELPRIGKKRNRKRLIMHRVILGLEDPKIMVDHIDRNGLNNQRNNIRICNQSQNMGNSSKRKGSTSKYYGVCWVERKKKWAAYLQTNRKSNNIGFYNSEEDAAKARDLVAKEKYGEFAALNF